MCNAYVREAFLININNLSIFIILHYTAKSCPVHAALRLR